MTSNITPQELFHRIAYISTARDVSPATLNKLMHETLVLTCAAGLSGTADATGGLFAKVDVLCKQRHISQQDTFDIQRMRHDSNSSEPLSREDLLYDCRALAVLVQKVFDADIPAELTGKIPAGRRPQTDIRHTDYRAVRGIVRAFEGDTLTVEAMLGTDSRRLTVDCSRPQLAYLPRLLREGMQVNLIDVSLPRDDDRCEVRQVIVEPDFLIDVSSLAACFTPYGHSPLNYTINRMKPVANSQAILIGGFASAALDDIINRGDNYDWRETFKAHFRQRALEYCTCPDLNQKTSFHKEAQAQVENIREAVKLLLGSQEEVPSSENTVQSSKFKVPSKSVLLEPTFICEQLGLQGRIDMMTDDFKLLVEQKSGKNFAIDCGRPQEHGSMLTEPHYVQVLLYYECLSRNFRLPYNSIDGRLLYSKYRMPAGLPHATYYRALIDEALMVRNQIVATEFYIAHKGFAAIMPHLQPQALRLKPVSDKLWNGWLYPQLSAVTAPLHSMDDVTRRYFLHMADFVYREQLASRLGVVEGTGNAMADLWNMPLTEKRETGNIYTGLTITAMDESVEGNGLDIVTLAVPSQGEDFLPNFRLGDSVYLYSYREGEEPDVRRALLHRGNITDIHSNELIVQLMNSMNPPTTSPQPSPKGEGAATPRFFAIEHATSGARTTAALRSLHRLISDETGHRELILAQREPQADTTRRLSRSYNPTYDDIILRAKQALDYFLLIGPPGTGKTSMALQYLVREFTGRGGVAILLMAYTNRAVDEICGMLCDNGIDFLRIGNEYTCDKRYRPYLLDKALEAYNRLDDIKAKILRTQVIVGTTSTMQSRSYLFNLKHFDVAIVDEASQILEPDIVGLLTHADKFILIGDYKQLPAVVQQDDPRCVVADPSLHAIGLTDCRNSLFQRLIAIEQMHRRTQFIGLLARQGRMHPEIADFPNREFYFAEHLQPVPLEHQTATTLGYDLPPKDELDRLLMRHRLLFFASRDCRRPDISDKVNPEEAHLVATLLGRIRRFYGERFDAARTVGVIVPYRNQIAMIRKEIEQLSLPELMDISIDTVERYQGSQRDVIIYSFTIQQRYQLDFLTANTFEEDGHLVDRKLNVALTRARKQLILTGNPRTLAASQLFRALMDDVRAKGGYVE